MDRFDVHQVADTKDIVGESPIWSAQEHALYWIDMMKPGIHRFEPASGDLRSWTPSHRPGSIVLRESGGALLALRGQLAEFDTRDGAIVLRSVVAPKTAGDFLTDGRCDALGRFWVGSASRDLQFASAKLYRVSPSYDVTTMAQGIRISNSIAWSPDNRTMYFADSFEKTIYAYDFDVASGQISDRRIFARTDSRTGAPDGSAVDCEGYLWNAEIDSGLIVRYAPDGSVDRLVELPVGHPTSCTFGGTNFDQLFVTTSSFRMSPEELVRQPWAGSLLRIDVGVKGTPTGKFAG